MRFVPGRWSRGDVLGPTGNVVSTWTWGTPEKRRAQVDATGLAWIGCMSGHRVPPKWGTDLKRRHISIDFLSLGNMLHTKVWTCLGLNFIIL